MHNVLKRDIPWETYLTARLISDRDLQLIRRYDKRNAETQQDLLTEVSLQPRTECLAWHRFRAYRQAHLTSTVRPYVVLRQLFQCEYSII